MIYSWDEAEERIVLGLQDLLQPFKGGLSVFSFSDEANPFPKGFYQIYLGHKAVIG